MNKEVTLVVGFTMPHSSQSTLAIHEENWNRLVQESNIPANIEQESRIVMSRTSSDLTNRKWIQDFICSIKGDANERLIKSILGKVAESELDVSSINKILERITDTMVSVGSNEKLLKILGELKKLMNPSVLTVTPSTEVVKIPDNLQDYQHESKSSSSIFVEGFQFKLPRHRRQNEIEWRKENKSSSPSADSLLDSKKCYGHREASNSEKKETSYGSWDDKEVMRELDSQSSRKKVEIEVGDQIYTIKNPYREDAYELGYKLADQIYDSIRESNTDICDIAQNLGFKADNIKNVKDHVFYNKHYLDRLAPAEPVEYRRFDANIQQALAWKRLETGTHTQDDITWIKHECAERHHELKYGSGYSEAHDQAQSRFDGAPWEDRF